MIEKTKYPWWRMFRTPPHLRNAWIEEHDSPLTKARLYGEKADYHSWCAMRWFMVAIGGMVLLLVTTIIGAVM